MKKILLVLALLIPSSSIANPNFWFSNKIEAGYGKLALSEKVTFEDQVFTKNTFGIGLKFKLSDNVKYETHYLLENSKKNNWSVAHILGAKFSFKF